MNHPEYGDLVHSVWHHSQGDVVTKLYHVKERSLLFKK